MAYTEADKAHAVAVYLNEGATAAALAVGASRQSVYVWLAESDNDDKKGEASRLVTSQRLARKRAAMVELFHDKALELAAAVTTDDPATTRFMLAACQAADKALLLAGLIRKTTDPVRLTVGELEGMIAEMEAELDKTQPHWRDSKSHNIDREMERLKAELEREVASELFEEINNELSRANHTPEQLERNRMMGDVVRRHLDRPMPYNGSPTDAA